MIFILVRETLFVHWYAEFSRAAGRLAGSLLCCHDWPFKPSSRGAIMANVNVVHIVKDDSL
jgi:hypothetical protein